MGTGRERWLWKSSDRGRQYININPAWSEHHGDFYFFKQLRRAGVPPTQRVHFYLAAIRAVLEYAAPVWHHLLTKTQLDQLEAIQKRAIRILYQCNGITYANMLYFAQLSNLSRRREELCRRFFNSITQPDSCLHTPPTSTRSYNSYPTQSCCKVSSNNYPN